MSSSPTTPERAQLLGRPDLLTLFRSVPDPRDPRGVRHPLGVILAVGVGDQSGEVIECALPVVVGAAKVRMHRRNRRDSWRGDRLL